jgi:ribosomal protein S21
MYAANCVIIVLILLLSESLAFLLGPIPYKRYKLSVSCDVDENDFNVECLTRPKFGYGVEISDKIPIEKAIKIFKKLTMDSGNYFEERRRRNMETKTDRTKRKEQQRHRRIKYIKNGIKYENYRLGIVEYNS